MELKQAMASLSALAQETRLAVFRYLVAQSPSEASAGALAERFAVAPSTLSFHLAHLERAGLLRSRRLQRQILYAADLDGVRRLLGFLTEDCCGGRPELCAPILSGAGCKPAPPRTEGQTTSRRRH